MRRVTTVSLSVVAGLVVVVALLGIVFIGGGAYNMYGKWSAKKTATRALEGYSVGSVPKDVTMEIRSENPERLSQSLRGGFDVKRMDSILWSYRSFEMTVRVADGSMLACDLYHARGWHLTCWDRM